MQRAKGGVEWRVTPEILESSGDICRDTTGGLRHRGGGEVQEVVRTSGRAVRVVETLGRYPGLMATSGKGAEEYW